MEYHLELPSSFIDKESITDFFDRVKTIDPKWFEGEKKIVIEYRNQEIIYIYYIGQTNVIKSYATCSEDFILSEIERMSLLGYNAGPI